MCPSFSGCSYYLGKCSSARTSPSKWHTLKTSTMAFSLTQPGSTSSEFILTPIMTLKGHEPFNCYYYVSSMCYFPDGKQMISGLGDKTARRWDLRAGKEIEEAREVCEQKVSAVEVSRDGQWVVIAGGDFNCGELKVCDVKTGIVRTLEDPSRGQIDCIDISADNTLLACRSSDFTVRIWSLDTGKLSAGPFRNDNGTGMGTVRFSRDSKKLAFKSIVASWLDVLDIETQKVDVRVGKETHKGVMSHVPMFWTTKDKTIVAVLNLNNANIEDQWATDHKTIYELDVLTLKTVGAPFEGHTINIDGLALSFDCALLASASCLDNTIKLWAFESRQLLASFDVQSVNYLTLSPDSHQLAYSTLGLDIHICDIPPKIIATIWPNTNEPKNSNILNSNATRRIVPRKPHVTSFGPRPQGPSPTTQRRDFFRYLRTVLSSRTNTRRNGQHRDPLDFPATSPLPRNYSFTAQETTHLRMNAHENSQHTTEPSSAATSTTFKARLRDLWTGHTLPPIMNVPQRFLDPYQVAPLQGPRKRSTNFAPNGDKGVKRRRLRLLSSISVYH